LEIIFTQDRPAAAHDSNLQPSGHSPPASTGGLSSLGSAFNRQSLPGDFTALPRFPETRRLAAEAKMAENP
jgi:hypothetical protein